MTRYSTESWKLATVLAAALAFLILAGCRAEHAAASADTRPTRVVVDVAGRSVAIPEQVKRIACMTGASYEKAFLVGGADKVVVRAAAGPPWMERTNPRVRQIQLMRNSHDPNMEELLKQNVDVLFFWDDRIGLHKLAAYGMAAVVPQPEKRVSTVNDFVAMMKSEVRLYGNVLGGEAESRAQAWCSYYDQRVNYVLERTKRLPEANKLKVYYVRGPDALTTQGYDQNITWYGEMAGARMVIRNSRARNIVRVSMEEMLRWDPDVIFVGRQYSPDLVLKDSRWKDIAAVRNHRVYVVPDGVFYWDSSSEGVLLLEYMAQTLYPGLFPDLDMKKEVRMYYARFYHYELKDDEAEKLLRGLDPDGRRRNLFNN